jgi:undecaprenyl-diphosphatase
MQTKDLNIKIRIIILSALIISFMLLALLAKNGGFKAFENGVYTTLARNINPALTTAMIGITNLGATITVTAIILALLILPSTRIKFGIPVAVNAVFSSVLNKVLKILIARDRPNILRLVAETGYGFPSGHAMNNAALYAIIIFLVFRHTRNGKIRLSVLIYGVTASFLIGISRIYLGVHNTGDVFAGWIMGVTIALLADTAYAAFLIKRKYVIEMEIQN